jgi:hypothetical protein
MKKIILSLSVLTLLTLTSCQQKPIRPVVHVQVTKVSNPLAGGTGKDNWTYWYIIPSNTDTGYYYYRCDCHYAFRDFSDVNFKYSPGDTDGYRR